MAFTSTSGASWSTREEGDLAALLRQTDASLETVSRAFKRRPVDQTRSYLKKCVKKMNKSLEKHGFCAIDRSNEQSCIMGLVIWFNCKLSRVTPQATAETIGETLKLGKFRQKIVVQLVPVDEQVQRTVTMFGYNPNLELIMKSDKTVGDVLSHIQRKWVTSTNNPILYGNLCLYLFDSETKIVSMSWGEDHSHVPFSSILDIHEHELRDKDQPSSAPLLLAYGCDFSQPINHTNHLFSLQANETNHLLTSSNLLMPLEFIIPNSSTGLDHGELHSTSSSPGLQVSCWSTTGNYEEQPSQSQSPRHQSIDHNLQGGMSAIGHTSPVVYAPVIYQSSSFEDETSTDSDPEAVLSQVDSDCSDTYSLNHPHDDYPQEQYLTNYLHESDSHLSVSHFLTDSLQSGQDDSALPYSHILETAKESDEVLPFQEHFTIESSIGQKRVGLKRPVHESDTVEPSSKRLCSRNNDYSDLNLEILHE